MTGKRQRIYSPTPFAISGLATIVLSFGVAGGWALTAPLASAVVAPASVAVEGNRKLIQHLEGGIIERIRVKEAQLVNEGEVLVELKTVEAIANLEILRKRLLIARAMEARLVAEQKEAGNILFPEAVVREGEPSLVAAVQGQRDLFEDRLLVLANQRDILTRRIGQIDRQSQGLEERFSALELQMVHMGREIERLRQGKELGAVGLNRLAAMEREGARLTGEIGATKSEIARVEQMRAETELEIIQLGHQFRERAVSELKDVRDEITQIEERVAVAADVLTRTEVRAPINGIVQNLGVHTIGGIVRPGDPIMEIVPVNDNLVINARVRAIDIDNLAPGMMAEVRFPAFSQREMPLVSGQVEFLSADVIIPEAGEEPFYLARVIVLEDTIDEERRQQLSPGMPAEVIIPTQERTVAQYLLEPLSQAIRSSMREH
ncbi:HlyD family type I secretion periplasmic adaptor subunit [Roseibium aggregatum]|uniref:Membrane fusion protein (MFP) family protein n=1 Tax=Roseibium aggregatum TaxID=187304 RepID=A0A0M6Y080_9HYPH|nr:HlyD family type I secretion periplasmic adaptor subunit [Roseibium aggregatum]CTQ42249.1 Type I secretion system membrane fusion protein PrsE [Roseibium aggregatum]